MCQHDKLFVWFPVSIGAPVRVQLNVCTCVVCMCFYTCACACGFAGVGGNAVCKPNPKVVRCDKADFRPFHIATPPARDKHTRCLVKKCGHNNTYNSVLGPQGSPSKGRKKKDSSELRENTMLHN